MIGSLWTGISGLAGSQTALDNESNNIANVNTIGFKSSRISFADQMYQNNIGKGTQVLDAEKLYSQGNLKTTGVNFDVALSGDGFFSVSNTRGGGTSETFYTRAGNFRMGDSGTLQDTIGNEVQGWAVGSEPTTVSSNPNVNRFTTDYTKLLSSKIVNYSSSIETITAKATNYTLTAQSDSTTVFSGAGLKSKSGKVSDVEELVKAYSTALQNLKSEPNSSSASAKAQISHIDLSNAGTADAVSQDGDEVYVYIDGAKKSISFISGDTPEDGYIKTMKAFADKISEIPGIKAYVAQTATPYTASTANTDVVNGTIRIESLVPGRTFTISSTAMVHAGNVKPGTQIIDSAADAGKGVGALETIRLALDKAITGKQTDVYTTSDLARPDGVKDYTYGITIYDKEQKKNVEVGPINITNVANIDALVAAINNKDTGGTDANKLPTYVKAYNVNGNLVVKTQDSNFDVEFSGDLKVSEYGHTVSPAAGLGVSEVHTYDLATVPSPDGKLDYLLDIVSTAPAPSASVTIPNAVDMDDLIAKIIASDTTKFELPTTPPAANKITVYKDNNGNLVLKQNNASASFTSVLKVDVDGATPVTYDGILMKRNGDYSGREGAGAEFLEIRTKIDQTASKGSLQLRLDTLAISDSAFGDFSVDTTGLITMSQDGAMFAVGQMAIAKFITNRGLDPIGNNLLKSTLASGDPIYNLNNNKTAEVKANTLELSTADLSESLVNLMVFQRAFEANSKSITTADTILNTLIQLKR